MDNKKLIKEENVTDNLTITTSMTYDEQRIFLQVDFMKGKYTLEKSFRNNYLGLEDYDIEYSNLNTEEKVKNYFGL